MGVVEFLAALYRKDFTIPGMPRSWPSDDQRRGGCLTAPGLPPRGRSTSKALKACPEREKGMLLSLEVEAHGSGRAHSHLPPVQAWLARIEPGVQ
ncbi:hypothetical protein GCM10010403_51330 [Glycomyces rutgersensis]|uniref:Uncharacterized protein n=1 Tax=Glycomyces rutgersensis TaxID=58115 RepID=A0ABP5TEK1_9ACTN